MMGLANASEYVAKAFRKCDRTLSVVGRPWTLGSSAKRSNVRSEGICSGVEHCDGKSVFQINRIMTMGIVMGDSAG
jgi:hypothetical protein